MASKSKPYSKPKQTATKAKKKKDTERDAPPPPPVESKAQAWQKCDCKVADGQKWLEMPQPGRLIRTTCGCTCTDNGHIAIVDKEVKEHHFWVSHPPVSTTLYCICRS